MFKNTFFKYAFVFTVLFALIVLIIHLVNIVLYSRNIEYLTVPFHSNRITEELDGYRIVFITDTHQISGEELSKMVRKINDDGGTDLVVLGGDFPNYKATNRTMQILSEINSVDGIYGVEGNHDMRLELFDAMKANGITPLLNSGVKIKDNLFLAGVEDLWVGQPDVQIATEHAESDDFVLLLSHNPDVTMQQNMSGVDLTLSGHTHGGHVTFLGIWAPALANTSSITDYGQRLMSGLCHNDNGNPVYVSNGTGYYSSIPRVFARPQLITIVLEKDKA